MRRAARVDGNHSQIVRELRQAGASVGSLARMGQGWPDLAVGWKGRNYFFEVKDPSKVPSDRRLTAEESDWHGMWTGQVDVIETTEQAIKIMERHATRK